MPNDFEYGWRNNVLKARVHGRSILPEKEGYVVCVQFFEFKRGVDTINRYDTKVCPDRISQRNTKEYDTDASFDLEYPKYLFTPNNIDLLYVVGTVNSDISKVFKYNRQEEEIQLYYETAGSFKFFLSDDILLQQACDASNVLYYYTKGHLGVFGENDYYCREAVGYASNGDLWFSPGKCKKYEVGKLFDTDCGYDSDKLLFSMEALISLGAERWRIHPLETNTIFGLFYYEPVPTTTTTIPTTTSTTKRTTRKATPTKPKILVPRSARIGYTPQSLGHLPQNLGNASQLSGNATQIFGNVTTPERFSIMWWVYIVSIGSIIWLVGCLIVWFIRYLITKATDETETSSSSESVRQAGGTAQQDGDAAPEAGDAAPQGGEEEPQGEAGAAAPQAPVVVPHNGLYYSNLPTYKGGDIVPDFQPSVFSQTMVKVLEEYGYPSITKGDPKKNDKARVYHIIKTAPQRKRLPGDTMAPYYRVPKEGFEQTIPAVLKFAGHWYGYGGIYYFDDNGKHIMTKIYGNHEPLAN
ncbi:unnamed protein product [Bursaphelenchus okinawaensis]|uniref:Uncharacterized protein n=1 Tax=Bursaphelenchus okinawaensis TaxID=465554 RepID=A0A811KNX6_9BILA|nr:unnamed protein product [Bursaphelenchus okinawaensis]CAG9109382.1 unnamed protein product [Bursaphelenchus okinawaensis]